MSVPQSIIDSAKAVESWLEEQNAAPPPPETQPQFLIRIGYSNLYKVDNAVLFNAGMNIDADGSPRAYNPVSSKGLDALANAGHPGNWWAIATSNGKPSGDPIIQGDSEPAPGFYVSTTSLENFAFPETRQGRYVDASKIPFIVLPFGLGMGLKLGDLCFVYNKATGDNSVSDLCRHRSPWPDWRRLYSFSHSPESAIQSQNGRRFSRDYLCGISRQRKRLPGNGRLVCASRPRFS